MKRGLPIAAILVLSLTTGCSTLSSLNPWGSEPEPAPPPPAAVVENVTATGQFVGDGDHIAAGTAEVVLRNGQWIIRLGEDFFLDSGTAPVVALGNEGYKEESVLGPLESYTGAQEYVLREGLNIGDYLQVFVWDTDSSTALAKADLTLL